LVLEPGVVLLILLQAPKSKDLTPLSFDALVNEAGQRYAKKLTPWPWLSAEFLQVDEVQIHPGFQVLET
jgi:hypothetical protein